MNIQTIIDLVHGSSLIQFRKNKWIKFLQDAAAKYEQHQENIKLIEGLDKYETVKEIILSKEDVIIYTVVEKADDDWNIKNPFRCVYINSYGTWTRCDRVCDSFDSMYMHYLQYKHVGANSDFAYLVMKMLDIKKEE